MATFPFRCGLAALSAVTVVGAACGGNGGSGGGGGGRGEADKSVAQIIADVQSALRSAKSFHMTLTITSQGTSFKFDVDTTGAGKLKATVTSSGASGQIVIADRNAYIRGKSLIAVLIGQQIADRVGDKALKVTADQAGGLAQLADVSVFARCLFDSNGTVSKGKTVTVSGHSAVELLDAGDKPGSQQGTLDVQNDPPAYPLHFETSGVRKAGGNSAPECGGPSSTEQDQQVKADLSNFGQSVDVTVPTDVVGLLGESG